MNNLPEEDEEEMEAEKVDDAVDTKELKANGAHLSADSETLTNGTNGTGPAKGTNGTGTVNGNSNGFVNGNPIPKVVINRVNGLKTETCI